MASNCTGLNESNSISPKNIIEIESRSQHSSNNKIVLYQIQGNCYGCLKYVSPARDRASNQTELAKLHSTKHVRFLID